MEPEKKTKQKACNGCTRAKKRCDLQHPSCRRCVLKGIECIYPSTRLHEHSNNTSTRVTSRGGRTSPLVLGDDNMQLLLQSDDQSLICSNNPLSPFQIDDKDGGYSMGCPTKFFLLPGSWIVMGSGSSRCPLRPVDQLNRAVRQVQDWMRQWVEEGGNMFIHRRLYFRDGQDCRGSEDDCFNMPRCIQDAYTTCAAYFACTPRNRDMMLKIVEQRVKTLLREEVDEVQEDNDDDDGQLSEYLQPEASPFQMTTLQSQTENNACSRQSETTKRSVLDHLARVQALLVYQFIRLYDGDLQSRATAESLIPILSKWSKQMLDSALVSSEYVSSMNFTTINQATTEKKLNSDWNAWILAESVRRTWLVVGYVQGLYRLLNYGVSSCVGGLTFTARAGLWHAESALEFGTRCYEKDVLFYQSVESGTQLLAHVSPEEVDDFGRYILQVIEGEDKVRKWLSRTT